MLSKLNITFVASVSVPDFRNHSINAKNNRSSTFKPSFIFRNKVSYISKCEFVLEVINYDRIWHFLSFSTRELRACARASYRYDVGNAIRSLDWLIPVNFF